MDQRWVEAVRELLRSGSGEALGRSLASGHLNVAQAEMEGALLQDPKSLQKVFEAASARLAQLASPGPELLEQEQQMSAAAAILRLVPSAIGSQMASCIVKTGLIPSLGSLMEAFARYPGDLQAVDSRGGAGQQLLALLLQCTIDVCEGAFKRGQGPTISCRDICGHELLPTLLTLAGRLSDSCSTACKRLSTELLLALLTRSRSNIEILRGSSRQDLVALYRSLLPGCGDFATQVNLVEVLYRLARNGRMDLCLEALGAAEGEASPPVKLFQALASDIYQGLDLAKELRKVVMAYNAHLGRNSTVMSVPSELIRFSLPRVQSAESWIDIGAGSMLSMSVTIHDPEDPGARDPPPEVLDIPFTSLASITLNDTSEPGLTRVDLIANQLPDLLQTQSTDRPLEVLVTLGVDAAQDLLLALPPLERSRLLHQQSQGHSDLWLQLSQEQEPGGGSRRQGAAGTQAQQRLSMGETTYKPLALQSARAPAPHGKPPRVSGAAGAPRAAAAAVRAAQGQQAAPAARKAAASDPGHSPLQQQKGRGRGRAASEGAAAAAAAQQQQQPGATAATQDEGEERETTIRSPAAPAPSQEGQQSPWAAPSEQDRRKRAGDGGLAEADLRASSPEESKSQGRRHRRRAQELLLWTPESRGRGPSAGAGDNMSEVDLRATDEEEEQPPPPPSQQQKTGGRGGTAPGSRPAAKGKATAAPMVIAAEVMLNGTGNTCTIGDAGRAVRLGRGEAATSTSSGRAQACLLPVATRTRAHDRQGAAEGRGVDAQRQPGHGSKLASPDASCGRLDHGRRAEAAALERRVSPRRLALGGAAKAAAVATVRVGKGPAAASAAAMAAVASTVGEAAELGSQPEWMFGEDEADQDEPAHEQRKQKVPDGKAGTPVSSKTLAPREMGEEEQQQEPPGSPSDLDAEDEGPTTTGDRLASAAARAGGRGSNRPGGDVGGAPAARSKAAGGGSKGAGGGKEGKGKGEGLAAAAAGEGRRQAAAATKGAAAAAAALSADEAGQAGSERQQQPRRQGAASPDPIEEDSDWQELAEGQGVKRQRPGAGPGKAGREQQGGSGSEGEHGGGPHGRSGHGAAGGRVSLRAMSAGSPVLQALPAAGALETPAASKQLPGALNRWPEVEQEELLGGAPGGSGAEEGRGAKRRRVAGAAEQEGQAGRQAGGGQVLPSAAPASGKLDNGLGPPAAGGAAHAAGQAAPATGKAGGKLRAPAARDVLDSAYQLKAPQALKGWAPTPLGAAQTLMLPDVVGFAVGSGVAVGRGARELAGQLRSLGGGAGGEGGEEQGAEQQEQQQQVSPGGEGKGREETETGLGGAVRKLRLSSARKPGAAGAGGLEDVRRVDQGGAGDMAAGEHPGREEAAKRRGRAGSGEDEEDGGVGEAAVGGERAGEGLARKAFALAPLPALGRAAAGQRQAAGKGAAAAAAPRGLGGGPPAERPWGMRVGAEAQERKRPALAPLTGLSPLGATAAPAPAASLHKLDLATGRAQGGSARAPGTGAAGAAAVPVAPLRLPSVALGRGKAGRSQAEGGHVVGELVSMLLGQDEDAEGDATADDDSRQLQALMLKIIENKRAKLKRRKEALMQDFLTRMHEGEQSLEAARAKVKQAAHDSIQRQLQQFQSSLDVKEAEMQALIQGFQAHLRVLWGEYEQEYQRVTLVREEMEGAFQSHMQQEQHAVQVYSVEVTAELAKLEEKLQALDSKRGVPDLAFLAKGARR